MAGHTCKVLELAPGARLDVAALRAHVAARLDRAPRLRQRLAPTPLALAPPAWVDDPAFDLERHVVAIPAAADLRSTVAELMAQRLDRGRPLWSLHAIEDADGAVRALVWKLHHCMADGATCMRLAADVLWDEGAAPRAGSGRPEGAHPVAGPHPGWRPAPPPGRMRMVADGLGYRLGRAIGEARGLLSPRAWAGAGAEAVRLPGTVARELRRAVGDGPLDRPIGGRRAVAFAQVPLDEAKRIGHAQPGHVTVNDVLLALVAGGLRRWMERHGAEPQSLRVKVPVSLHDRDAHPDALANRDSFLCVGLPLEERDPVVRLRAIAAATAERKRRHDAETLDALFAALRHAGRPLARFGARLSTDPGTFALTVSNVPGPPTLRHVAGAPVERLLTLAEIGEHHVLRISALSYAGTLAIGLCADATAIDDLDALATGIEAEAESLERGQPASLPPPISPATTGCEAAPGALRRSPGRRAR